MKKKVIVASAIAAGLALCAAVWPQNEAVEETPRPTPAPAVTAPQPRLPEPEKLVLNVATEKEMVEIPEAEPTPETTFEESATPAPDIEKQTEANQASSQPAQPEPIQVQSTQPEPEPTPDSKPEVSDSNLENMVYVEGFGWIESKGPNHVEYAEDMYENGNKIGSMG